jgi:hypothetical protein
MRYAILVLAVLIYGCATVTPQQRMKDCNAAAKDLKGDERKAFMSQCLKA